MKNTIISLIVLILFSAPFSQAGYNDMKDGFDSYRPSPYYESQLRPSDKRPPSMGQNSFEAEVLRLSESRTRWEQKIRRRQSKESFAVLDPTLLPVFSEAKKNSAAAAAALSDTFSETSLEALVLVRNPSIEAARLNVQAAIEAISQIANLDEILRQYSAITKDAMSASGPMKGKDAVTMKFPFPGVMSLKGQIVDRDIELAWLNLDIATREAVTAARKAFWNLRYIRKAHTITDELLQLLTHLEEVATTRYESGKTSYQDVIKVRINRETLEENLTTLKARQKNIEIRILSLLNLPFETRVGLPADSGIAPPTPPELSGLFSLAREHNQEIRRHRARIAKMERMVDLAETMIYPPYTLNLSVMENNPAKNVGTFNMKDPFPTSTSAYRGAGLPKNAWFGTNDAFIRQTRHKLAALKVKLEHIEDRTMERVRKAWFDIDRSQREAILFGSTIVDLSQTSLEVSSRGYETGNVMFADVFVSYDIWFKAKLALERKRSDMAIHWAELERVVGKKLTP